MSFIKDQTLIAIDNLPLPGNSISPPLDLEQKYIVRKIYTCGCGQDHIDVGLKSKYEFISCYTCKKALPEGTIIHWCHPSRFKENTAEL